MNVERLMLIAHEVTADWRTTEVPRILNNLANALQQQANAPAEPAYQQQVRNALVDLEAGARASRANAYSPAWRQMLREIGVDDLLGQRLYDQVESIIQRNGITPAIAHADVAQLSERINLSLAALDSLESALESLAFESEELYPGTAEASVSIPRGEVRSELGSLGREFQNLKRLVGPFQELADGSRPDLEVKAISSSDYTVLIALLPGAAWALLEGIDKVLSIYERVQNIKAGRQVLADNGLSDEQLAQVDAQIHATLDEGIREAAAELLAEYRPTSVDVGRTNELNVELVRALEDLATRLDHQYRFDVRATPYDEGPDTEEPAEPDDNQRALLRIQANAPRLQRLVVTGRPILALTDRESGDPGQD